MRRIFDNFADYSLVYSPTIYSPTQAIIDASQLTAFMRYCEAESGLALSDTTAFHDFTMRSYPRFWALLLRWSRLLCEGSPDPVCTDDACEHATFFPNLRLNYAENLLRTDGAANGGWPALTACHAAGGCERMTRQELRDAVLRFAAALRRLGVAPGDRVVAIVGNNAEAVIAALGAATVGAPFAAAAPDMGEDAILDRFAQLAPAVMVANAAPRQEASLARLPERVAAVARGLPSLRGLIVVDDGVVPADVGVPVHRLSDLPDERVADGPVTWQRFPFNHPLFILFSSGTTGRPKCIVHGAGGTLIEHVKEHRLHGDLRASDRMFFHTTAAWMMWNWQLSALACGAEIVVYDGPVTGPETLWRLVAERRVSVFGTSPPYLQLCQDAGYSPRRAVTLPALRAVLSTGSILHDRQYDWVHEEVGAIPLQSISGGSDIIGCFVLGNPNLPVRRGECQGRSLGLDVQALGGPVGELVCRNPFPSRPVGLYDDPDGSRFHAAYFSQNPGVWTHGDLIEFTPHGGARMHGRSDGVLNVNGVRVGPAEIYRLLQDIPEIREALAVEQADAEVPGRTRMVLLVLLHAAGTLDGALKLRIRRDLARRGSPAHVPAVIAEVDELPVTHSGKRSERAAADALNGKHATNLAALRNPACLEMIRHRVAREDAHRAEPPEAQLRAIWEHVLGVSPIGLDDDFFELGGTSLLAVQLFWTIHQRLGLEAAPALLFQAPTVRTLARRLGQGDGEPLSALVLLKPGTAGPPLFMLPGGHGDPVELRSLVQRLHTTRPVYGLRARGLAPDEQPHASVEEAAAACVDVVRRVQPAGPYALVGYSYGGLVAFEMARRLRAAGDEVAFLGLVDSNLDERCLTRGERLRFRLERPVLYMELLAAAPRKELAPVVRRWLRAWAPRLGIEARVPDPVPEAMRRVGETSLRAIAAYRPAPYEGHATFFRAERRRPRYCDPLPVWARAVRGGLTVKVISGRHVDVLREPYVSTFADRLEASLRACS